MNKNIIMTLLLTITTSQMFTSLGGNPNALSPMFNITGLKENQPNGFTGSYNRSLKTATLTDKAGQTLNYVDVTEYPVSTGILYRNIPQVLSAFAVINGTTGQNMGGVKRTFLNGTLQSSALTGSNNDDIVSKDKSPELIAVYAIIKALEQYILTNPNIAKLIPAQFITTAKNNILASSDQPSNVVQQGRALATNTILPTIVASNSNS